MFLNITEWKIICAIHKVGKLEPRDAETILNFCNEEKRKIYLSNLVESKLVEYYWVTGGYSSYSDYHLTSTGRKIASKSFLIYNATELLKKIEANKTWISIVTGLISLSIVISKC